MQCRSFFYDNVRNDFLWNSNNLSNLSGLGVEWSSAYSCRETACPLLWLFCSFALHHFSTHECYMKFRSVCMKRCNSATGTARCDNNNDWCMRHSIFHFLFLISLWWVQIIIFYLPRGYCNYSYSFSAMPICGNILILLKKIWCWPSIFERWKFLRFCCSF